MKRLIPLIAIFCFTVLPSCVLAVIVLLIALNIGGCAAAAFKFRLAGDGLFTCRTWSPGHYAESTKTILILGQNDQ